MKTLLTVQALTGVVVVLSGLFDLHAATIDKTNNVDNLNLGTSWKGELAPTANDIAQWSSLVTGPNTVSLGADLSWSGIRIGSPGGAVKIGAGNTLTLGASGIDMGSATTNLTISSSLSLLANTRQVWNILGSRKLTLDTGAFTRGAGALLSVQGSGAVAASTVANDATGIIGPWASIGIGTSTRFAAASGGSLVPFTGTTAASAASVTDTTGNTNYEVAAVGALGAGAAFHTMRYTGAAGTITNAFQADGLMNVGSGVLTLSGALTIGASQELVVNLPSQNLTLSAPVSNNIAGASAVTKTGSSQLNLDGICQFTGPITIGEGIVKLGGNFVGGLYPGNVFLGSSGVLQVNNGNSQTLTGTVSGGGTIDRWGGGALTLAGSNSFLGTVQINAGSVKLGHAAALGSTSGATQLKRYDDSNRGKLELNGFSTSEPLSFEDTGNAGSTKGYGGYVENNTSTNAVLYGAVTLNKHGTFRGTGITVIKGLVSGSGDFVKDGSGDLQVDTNTMFTGNIAVIGGNLHVTQSGRLSGGSYAGNIALAGAVTWNSSYTQTLSGVVSGAGTLYKWRQDGVLILGGTNSFTGSVQLNAGTVKLASSNALGTVTGTTQIRRHDDGNRSTLDLNGQSVGEPLSFEDNAVAGSTLGYGGFLENNNTLSNAACSGAVALNRHGTVRGTGNITLSGVLSGTGRLIKQGNNTLTLSGANSYTGTTVVASGTLQLGASNVLPDVSEVVLSGGTLDAGSATDTAASLTVTSGGTLALGTGQLTFGNSAGKSWSGVLTLTGTLGPNSLYFPDFLTPAQVLSMTYNGNRVYLTPSGHVVDYPPGTLIRLQ
jgi:autotransporter-associated beta strand protein